MQPQADHTPTILKASLIYSAVAAITWIPLIGGFLFFSDADNGSGVLIMLPLLLIVVPASFILPVIISQMYLKKRRVPSPTKIALMGLLGSFILFPIGIIGLMLVGGMLFRDDQPQPQGAAPADRQPAPGPTPPVDPAAPAPPQSQQ